MNVTESRKVAAVLRAAYVDRDLAAALPIAEELAERTRMVLQQTGNSYVSPGQLTAAANGEDGPRCIHCGCTDEDPCAGGCMWVPGPMDGDLCSRCEAELSLIAAALDDAAGYRDMRRAARCEACATASGGVCAEHQADEDRGERYRDLLAARTV